MEFIKRGHNVECFINSVKKLKNKAITTSLVIVGITIIVPLLFILTKRNIDLTLVPFLVITYIICLMLDNSMHKLYLKKEDKKIERTIENDIKKERQKHKAFLYSIVLLLTVLSLFIIGNMLGNTLENLCKKLNVSQIYIGIILGFFTSMPELITFLESQAHHKKKNNDNIGIIEATNNLLMSNTMNIFIIFTIGILIRELK